MLMGLAFVGNGICALGRSIIYYGCQIKNSLYFTILYSKQDILIDFLDCLDHCELTMRVCDIPLHRMSHT